MTGVGLRRITERSEIPCYADSKDMRQGSKDICYRQTPNVLNVCFQEKRIMVQMLGLKSPKTTRAQEPRVYSSNITRERGETSGVSKVFPDSGRKD